MSIRLMSAVWDMDLPAGEKIVLLALADQANDEGRQCWPSVETIMRRSGQGERTVRRALSSLEEKGHLTRNHRVNSSTQYHIHPCQNGTPANLAPVPNPTAGGAKSAPKPSRTTIPCKASPSKGRVAKIGFDLPADIPAAAWAGYEEMRKAIRKPMTPKARDLAVARLRKLAEAGYPPGDVLNHSTLNNYQGLFPPKDESNGNRTARRMDGQPDLRGPRPDPALDLLRAARAAEAEEERSGSSWPDYRGDWAALPAQ